MSVTAQSVLKHVYVDVLQDVGCKKWPIAQGVRYLNRIQQLAGIFRPDLFVEKRAHALVAGVRQTLPSGYVRPLDFLCNTSGRAVTMPANGRALLDAQKPNWRNDAQSDTIYHVFFDEREPLAYDVFPPAALGASLDVKLQKAITPIAEPGAGLTWSAVSGNLSIVDDPMWTAIADGICYLAYAKDAQHAAQGSRAATHLQAMAAVLGNEMQAALQAGPKTDTATPIPASM